LEESVWQQATLLKDFLQTQPGDNVRATHPTEVLLGFDSDTHNFRNRAASLHRSTVTSARRFVTR
ncbi:MAG: hypothetical protein ACREXY_16105, partial [Gammaproteobacteria bacterium]